MNKHKRTSSLSRLGVGVLAAGSLAMGGLGLAATAQAAPAAPLPAYHWCPGDNWDNHWGNNPGWHECHDWDGPNAPAGYGPPGPPPWAPPPPPPPFWAPWAQVSWNADANGWGFWNGGVWVPV